MSAGGRGVTLFRDSGFKGASETFSTDVPDLSRTRVGARQASSIEVPAGYPRSREELRRPEILSLKEELIGMLKKEKA